MLCPTRRRLPRSGCDFASKSDRKWCPWVPESSPGRPHGTATAPQGRPRRPRMTLEAPRHDLGGCRGPFCLHFGFHFGVIFGIFLQLFLVFSVMVFVLRSWCFLASFFYQIFDDFGRKKPYKKQLFFRAAPGVILGAPRHHPKSKKLDFAETVVQNRRSTFSRPSAPGIDFGVKNDAKTEPQINKKP